MYILLGVHLKLACSLRRSQNAMIEFCFHQHFRFMTTTDNRCNAFLYLSLTLATLVGLGFVRCI